MFWIFSILLVATLLVQTTFGQETETDWRLHVISAKERTFDFKTVAKGAVPEHRFVLRNPLVEPIHIGGITSSCTCTTLRYDEKKTVLNTYEEFVITVRFRGDLFSGPKNATISVALDKPNEVIQLDVRGEIRSDLKTSPPGFIDFGNVELGKESSRELTVTYEGNNSRWQLVDTKSENEFVSAVITPDFSRVGIKIFKIKITLDKDAPNGIINTHLVLMSNDAGSRREIPIPIRATVGTVVTATPPNLLLGVLSPGESSPTKNVMLRGTKPFRITKIECDNPAVDILPKIASDTAANIIHQILVSYQNPVESAGSPTEDGTMRAEIRITTDVPDLVLTFHATASVRKKVEEE
jgi:hypothetical protein